MVSYASKASQQLTSDGDEDDDKVEDVPRFFEVMPAQSKQLEDALEREDGDEHLVDVGQGAGEHLVDVGQGAGLM